MEIFKRQRTNFSFQRIFCFFSLFFKISFGVNPIITHKYTADPHAMVHEDRVYIYCSNDEKNSLRPNGGVDYAITQYTVVSSDDLVNWVDHGEVFQVPRDARWASRAYAPACIQRNKKFYLYFPNGGNNIGVAVADNPLGPFSDPLGKSLINRSMPNCNVEWCFDPAAFIDGDGQAYLYFGGGMRTVGKNLRVIKLNEDMISVTGAAVSIDAPLSFEAAYMHKFKGTYYFTYSTNGASKIDYMTSGNPMTGFLHRGTILDNPSLDGKNINHNNNNHASVFYLKENWYIAYHDRRLSGKLPFRNVCVDALTFNADGTMNKVNVSAQGVKPVKMLNPYIRTEGEAIGSQQGITTAVCDDGGRMVVNIGEGDWIKYYNVEFGSGAGLFQVRVASPAGGGSIELRLGGNEGPVAGTCPIPPTGGWGNWNTLSCPVSGCSGVKDLVMQFKGAGEPFRMNWFTFQEVVNIKMIRFNRVNIPSGTAGQFSSLWNHPYGSGPLYDVLGRSMSDLKRFFPAKAIYFRPSHQPENH